MKTFQPKEKDIRREWHFIDAKGQVLGRLATRIVGILTGKNKSAYSTHLDMGDFVVVVNAKDIELTGKKKLQKTYKSHSGYPGGFKEVSFAKLQKESPEKILEKAVSGMLPDNRLKSARLARLRIFADENNPYRNKFKQE